MKIIVALLTFITVQRYFISSKRTTQVEIMHLFITLAGKNLYIDVHQLKPGKVKYEDVAKAHLKILL